MPFVIDDLLLMAALGAGAGALTSKRDPLKGALIGGTLGGVGGAFAPGLLAGAGAGTAGGSGGGAGVPVMRLTAGKPGDGAQLDDPGPQVPQKVWYCAVSCAGAGVA